MDSLTFSGSVFKSKPAILALPFWTGKRVVRTLITVLFPAPFGPRNEKISPFLTVKLILSTAFTSPKKYSRSFTSIILSSRTGTSLPLYLKRIEPLMINRYFAVRIKKQKDENPKIRSLSYTVDVFEKQVPVQILEFSNCASGVICQFCFVQED